MVCKMWMLTFASLLIMISLMTGTKRQIFGWLVSMSSLLIAYWFSPTPKLYGPAQYWLGEYWHHLGDDITGLVNSTEAIFRLAVVCLVVYVMSFVFSFLLDRFVGPINGEPKERSGADEEADINGKKVISSGRIRLLIFAAAILFVVQSASNLSSFILKAAGKGQIFLIAIVASLIPLLCCGAVCRLRRWSAFRVGAVAAISMSGVGVALGVGGGLEVNTELLTYAFVFFTTVLAVVFVFLGNSRQPIRFAKFGWLFVVTAALAIALPVVTSKYDLYSLLLTSPQFDFEEAAFRKELNSYPGADITMERSIRGYPGSLTFEFGPTAADSFFDDLDSSKLPNSIRLVVSGIGVGMHLNNLKNYNVVTLDVSRCELTTKQLAELARLQVPIRFVDCNFIKSELEESGLVFSGPLTFESRGQIRQRSGASDVIVQFVDATSGFCLESEINIRNSLSSDGFNTVLDLVEKIGDGATVTIRSIDDKVDVEGLARRKNLERLSIASCVFRSETNLTPSEKAGLTLLVKTEAEGAIRANQVDIDFWKLAVGVTGKFKPIGIDDELAAPKWLDSLYGEDSPFVYQSNDASEVERLWLPQCSDDVLKKVSGSTTLKSVSFDINWLGNQHLTWIATSGAPAKLQEVPLLNKLTELEELYFAGMEVVDLSLLTDLTRLKTIQFGSGSPGFSQKLFPNLEEVRIVLDQPIKNGLMRELKAIESLKRLVVIDIHVSTFDEDKFLEQARALFGDQVEVSVVDVDDGRQLVPAEFESHRERVRQGFIEKYLE